MTLFINACLGKASRTLVLAKALLQRLGPYTEVSVFDENLRPHSAESLKERDALIAKCAWEHPMFRYAKQFAEADCIVIAAPYWDLSFPAQLKIYLENIYVPGLVSSYDAKGMPVGLCRAEKLYYVTTAGGPYSPKYSFDLLDDLCRNYFGIPKTQLLKADMLDIAGNDAEALVQKAIAYYGL